MAGYNVMVAGELLALKPNNVRAAAAPQQGGGGAGQAPGFGAGQAAPGFQLPAGVDPKYVALGAVAVLVMVFGVPVLTAGLLATLGLLTHSAARREGGLLPAGKMFANRAAAGLQRLTGKPTSTAQAVFVLAALALLVWYYWLGGSGLWSGRRASSSYRADGYGDAGGYGGGSRGARGGYDTRGYGARGYDSYGHGDSSWSGYGSGVDLSFLLACGMLALTVWNMGGGGRPEGWSVGQLVHRLQNMDLWQMMMLFNLLQQVLGGGRRRGGFGGGMGGFGRGFGRRPMYF